VIVKQLSLEALFSLDV